MIGGIPLYNIYFYALIICAVLAVLLFVFGDVFEFDGPFDPMLIVPWIAFISLIGYIFEKTTYWDSFYIFLGALAASTVVVLLLNFYVVVPLKNTESTLSSSEKDLEGQKATVVTTIPMTGMGEIQIKSVTGSTSRPATFYEPQENEVLQGQDVLIIEIRDRVCYVVPYKESF